MFSRTRSIQRGTAAGLACLVLTALTMPAAAAAAPTVDESYYATLDPYGQLTEGGVVKSYRTNGTQVLWDTGVYDDVVNLTDRTEPEVQGDQVKFDLGPEVPDRFYFEGKTAKPYQEMPFHLELSYRMNGVETEAEDMAGQTGVGEIHLKVTPNPNASEYAKNNFVLTALAMFRGRDLLSLEAPGCQIQKLGDQEAVMGMVLPGETQHFVLRVGSEDFSFGGFTFMVQPMTMAQMQEIPALRQVKEKTEESYHDITASVTAILDEVSGLDQKLSHTADGLDQLNDARSSAASEAKQVLDQADRTLNTMSNLSQSLTPVVQHLKTGKRALAEIGAKVDALTSQIDTLRPSLQALSRTIAAVQQDLTALSEALSQSEVPEQMDSLLSRLGGDLQDLQNVLTQVQDAVKNLDNLPQLKPISPLKPLTVKVGEQEYPPDELRAMLKTSDLLYTCCQAVAKEDPLHPLPRTEDKFVHYVLEHKEAITAQANAQDEAEEAVRADLLQRLEHPDDVKVLVHLHFHKTTLSKQIETAEEFNRYITQANQSIGQVNDSVDTITSSLSQMTEAISQLTGSLRDGLLEDSRTLIQGLQELLTQAGTGDSAALQEEIQTLLSNVQTLLDQADTILAQGSAVTDTLKQYKPAVNAAMNDAIQQASAAVQMLSSLNEFSQDMEGLVRTAGPKLNTGAASTLDGMSDSLRQMSSGLDAVDSARSAGDSVTTLIEDTWNDYTGEKNQMLNMDPNAPKVSLTSPKNPAPASVQLVLRSEGIREDPAVKAAAQAETQTKTTLWDRILRMFRDFAAIFTGD